MTRAEKFSQTPSEHSTIYKRMLMGGGIALAAILFFVIDAGKGRPEWGAYWMIKPLLLTPLIGAIAGAGTYKFEQLGLNKALTIVLNLIGYLLALWIGVVLGLNGTMWN